jgi:hypothetical protein
LKLLRGLYVLIISPFLAIQLMNFRRQRNRTLRSSMLEALAPHANLKTLEINGNSKWSYDPALLNNLQNLEELRIVLPDRNVTENLKQLLRLRATTSQERESKGLRVLEIISQDSRWINDSLLQDLAPFLRGLEVFKLWGCAHVGPRGYFEVLRWAQGTLREVALEGVGSVRFSLSRLVLVCWMFG